MCKLLLSLLCACGCVAFMNTERHDTIHRDVVVAYGLYNIISTTSFDAGNVAYAHYLKGEILRQNKLCESVKKESNKALCHGYLSAAKRMIERKVFDVVK